MLVEDDNNLREIYEARLLAEGYEIVSAKDGEEALALAVKEKPDLIISDVMMPKISGFDMLDILRSTAETKNTKVIMMTALSQAEDKSRADKLGADRYLVKSQVTLEDVAKVTREVLQGETAQPAAAPVAAFQPSAAPVAVAAPPPPVTPPAAPVSSAPEPTAAPGATSPVTPAAPAVASSNNDDQGSTGGGSPPAPQPPQNPPSSPPPPAAPAGNAPLSVTADLADTAAAEEEVVETQINQFVASQQTEPEPEPQTPPEPVPTATTLQSDSLDTPQPTQKIEVQDAPPGEGSNNAAADAAQKLAGAVNDLLSPTVAGGAANTTPSSDSPSAHKRVISPITDTVSKDQQLSDLIQQEAESGDASTPNKPPATSIVSPGGQTITPVTPDTPPSPTQPGNLIQPSGGQDPSSIAL